MPTALRAAAVAVRILIPCLAALSAPAHGQTLTLEPGPVAKRLYARDALNRCVVPMEGKLSAAADQVVLTVLKNGAAFHSRTLPVTGTAFSLSDTLASALASYAFELTATNKGASVASYKADSVLCGDAFLVYGQSNAEALYGADVYTYRSPWFRTYEAGWKTAQAGDGPAIGTLAMHLGRQIVEKQQVPVCIINGAKGNTSIEHLSPDAVLTDADWLKEVQPYGNFYKRLKGWVTEAGLANGVKGLVWSQGERNAFNQGYIDYDKKFLALRQALLRDLPGLKRFYLLQTKTGCGVGDIGWSYIFEAQRGLASSQPDVDIMGTFGPGITNCHYGNEGKTAADPAPYPLPGYERSAERLYALIDSVQYGGKYDHPITPPDILRAGYSNSSRNEVVLEFNQPVDWNDSTITYNPNDPYHYCYFVEFGKAKDSLRLRDLFALDSTTLGQVASGSSTGNRVYLKLRAASHAKRIAYPQFDVNGCWVGPYLTGSKNKLGALGFFVPLGDSLSPVPAAPAPARKIPDRIVFRSGALGEVTLELPMAFSLPGREIRMEVSSLDGKRTWTRTYPATPEGRLILEAGRVPQGAFLYTLRCGDRMLRGKALRLP
jgi:hypothetical protein